MTIKVAVVGAMGKMGQEVVKAVLADASCELACAVDKFGVGTLVTENISVQDDIKTAFSVAKPDVVVDFTQPSVIYENIKLYMQLKVKSVIGTTGLTSEQLNDIEKMSIENNTGCFIAPNFSTGAILMMKFAQEAAKYFSNAEILEFHHNQKKDSPSGTAIKTAELMSEVNSNFKLNNCDETETIEGSRGGCFEKSNLQIHAIRMPGFVASQEVVFGSSGQTLKIRHDSINRECYMGGVLMAVNYVVKNNNFMYGLENIL